MQVCTSLQTDNHASTPPLSFLQAGCPSCRPTNSIKALKVTESTVTNIVMTKDVREPASSYSAGTQDRTLIDYGLWTGGSFTFFVYINCRKYKQRL